MMSSQATTTAYDSSRVLRMLIREYIEHSEEEARSRLTKMDVDAQFARLRRNIERSKR